MVREDENGYIVVETIGCFTLFVLLNIAILSLINIVTVQARVHYALTQAADTVSMYCYTLDITGVAEHLPANASQADKAAKRAANFKGNIDALLDALNHLSPSGVQNAAGNLYDQVNDVASDPEAVLKEFINLGINTGINKLFETAVRPLVLRYLANGEMSGEEYLQSARVVGDLDFYQFRLDGSANSSFLENNGEIKLVVQYDIDYTFGILPLPAKLHVTQEVITKAWLSGNGTGYTG